MSSVGPRGPLSRRALLAGMGLVPAAVLVGCTPELGATGDTGNQQGFVGGGGAYRALAPAERGDPVVLSGETTHGDTVDVADWRGQVVVLNVWYATCAPCRTEAPDLAAIAGDTPDVRFLGINTDDGLATANSFEREFAIPYPSLLDADTGRAVLALRGTIPPQAVPSTVILDTEGRPAALIVGRAAEDVLRGLIADVQGSSGAA